LQISAILEAKYLHLIEDLKKSFKGMSLQREFEVAEAKAKHVRTLGIVYTCLAPSMVIVLKHHAVMQGVTSDSEPEKQGKMLMELADGAAQVIHLKVCTWSSQYIVPSLVL
jgi:hypothetical protein